MGAKSSIEINEKENIVDDIMKTDEAQSSDTNDLDQDKLSALKARLASKQKESEMTSKIVAKKERSINFGIVGSGQAGCIDGNTNIYLSEYGIIPIERFFYNKLSSSKLENINVQANNDICIKLDQDIYTVSIDPETGKVQKGKVIAVWKNKKTSKNTLKLSNGASLSCSKTHPSLVFRPSSKQKAFFSSLSSSKPLSVGDTLFDTRNIPIDIISQKTYVRNIEITNQLSWLLGVFVGDGHDKLSGNSISFYSNDSKLTENIVETCKLIPHTSISVNSRAGCEQIEVFGLQFRLFFESALNLNVNKTNGGFGHKTYEIDIPSCISAGSLEVRSSFLSGLIDSDGTVNSDWCEASIYTTSINLANKLGCLISSIGARSSFHINNRIKENEHVGYKIRISGKFNFGPMAQFICESIKSTTKNHRLLNHLNKKQQSFATSCALIDYKDISFPLIKEGKLTNPCEFLDKTGLHIKNWVNGEKDLSLPSFIDMISMLEKSEYLTYLSDIVPSLIEVKEIEENNAMENDFFDLTIEKYENYVAGNNGFIFTHNSRIAESFYKLGYDAVALNTASQDLKFIDIPQSNKLLLEYGLGGASRELEIGRAAAETNKDAILELVSNKLQDAQVLFLTSSLGGGSGAGSLEVLVDLLSSLGKPLIAIAALPMESDDSLAKGNALKTLSLVAKSVQNKKLVNLIVVDNAKIEVILQHVNQMDFFDIANKTIVEPLDIFNTFSMMPSAVKAMDSMEWAKVLTDGEGLTIYGSVNVNNYIEDTAIAESVISNLSSNMLASGFDLKQTKYAGVMMIANKKVWDKIPSSSINYGMSMISDLCGMPKGIFKGIYCDDSITEDTVKVYSVFSGLSLPTSRVDQLKKETQEHLNTMKTKDMQRNLSLNIDTGDSTISEAQKIKEKIAAKTSGFGKLTSNVIDRRK